MSFKTVLAPVQAEIVIKKSKFICQLFPAKTVEEAEAAITAVRKEHYNATHNVPAYLVGEHYKYSDDGEPAGTAGAVMLDVLKKEGFDYVAAVVTRYFGGIKLGKGGLVRAYTDSLKAAIEAGGVPEFVRVVSEEEASKSSGIAPKSRGAISKSSAISIIQEYLPMTIKTDYTALGSLEYYIAQEKLHISATDYTDCVVLSLYSFSEKKDSIISAVNEITSGGAEVIVGEPVLLDDKFQKF